MGVSCFSTRLFSVSSTCSPRPETSVGTIETMCETSLVGLADHRDRGFPRQAEEKTNRFMGNPVLQ